MRMRKVLSSTDEEGSRGSQNAAACMSIHRAADRIAASSAPALPTVCGWKRHYSARSPLDWNAEERRLTRVGRLYGVIENGTYSSCSNAGRRSASGDLAGAL